MAHPELSMLWETTDAAPALERRFGFTDVDSAAEWCEGALRTAWGNAGSVDRFVISGASAVVWTRTDRGPVVVKLSCAEQLFERLEASTQMPVELATRGIPVAAPIPALDGRVVLDGPTGPLSMAVLPEIEGSWLDVEDLAKASVYLGTLFHDWQPTAPAAGAALRAGYESVRSLGPEEAMWLEALTLWQAIMAVPADDASGAWADAASMPLWTPAA